MFSERLKNTFRIAAAALTVAAALLPARAADTLALVNQKEIDTTAINSHTRNYWAYRSVTRPEPPAVQNKAWVRNPIDAFILARLEAANLEPVAAADKRTLIRRATYDLIGLPPTRKEVEAFVADQDPRAYEKLIDDLLARPQYGEKWGRHWLDLVRYAETNGYERDGDKPEVWRYRDYVIRSFNEDKPYNRFLMEQLAGDEMEPVTADAIIATGYLRLGIWDDEPADRELARYDELDGIVSTTGSVMLGASLGCARCHDHKKDPIKQKDYYSLLAFFHNIRGYSKGKGNLVDLPAADPARITQLAARIQAIEKQFLIQHPDLNETALPADRTLIADARHGGAVWRYAPLRQAPGNWAEADFKPDKGWRQGRGGFGNGNPPNSKTRTRWVMPQIVLHKSFVLKAIPPALRMSLYHDEDVEVLINGRSVFQAKGYLTRYKTVDLPDPKTYLKKGTNLIAVRCRQTGGGQYIDVGLEVGGPTLATLMQRDGRKVLGEAEYKQYLQTRRELEQLKNSRRGRALAIRENGPNAPKTHILKRGLPAAKMEQVAPAYPTILGHPAPQIPKPEAGARTSGRRLVLAKWIGSRENKLTARVMANRLWQFHFGRGIVATPNDFGRLGAAPTHPKLLDWLAAQFMDHGWSMKKMHRLIMTSSAYRMSSKAEPKALVKDPTNKLLWRFDMRRLTAEEIRDSILSVTGELNLKMAGPSIYPPLPAEVLATASRPGRAWGKSPPDEAARRSIYIKVKRSLRFTLLVAHDQADTDNSCAVRFTTTVPTQALTMINSEFMNRSAANLARRARTEAGDAPAGQVELMLSLVTQRRPTAREVAEGVRFLKKLQEQQKLTADRALQQFGLIALNLNEFVYLD